MGLCTYTHARVRASGFLFRKQNNVGSDTRKQNTGFPSLFRKLNKGRDEKTVNGVFLGRCLKSGKRSRAPSLCIRTHTRARWLRSFLAFVSFIGKNSFFFFSFFYIFSFFLFFILKRVIFFSFSLFLKKASTSNMLIVIT